MKKLLAVSALGLLLGTSAFANNSAKGLNVLVTSEDAQTQMMSMVLSMMTLKQNKKVNMVLCSKAGDLALKNSKSEVLKPMDKSPKMMLKAIIKKGASVKVCPLYLPNKQLKESDLMSKITVAKPMEVSKDLLNTDYKNLSY
ncbi:hypothetical protein CP960_00320 [Malaciobacter halophilus]|uniref:DsrE family protein n=1 Tax=Malaciobacter halophilus TaxID=197482 RepID=A0A2N1J6Q4_9BACT|nr:hypothetical protein [Malaciobacter halophilus]AXH10018.1 hypothetical protein AHALO_1652 [Malaciobacter halophilus]PKI82233.1 hypothetical protein CP960_00320 [Malaciobacter halophilus]